VTSQITAKLTTSYVIAKERNPKRHKREQNPENRQENGLILPVVKYVLWAILDAGFRDM